MAKAAFLTLFILALSGCNTGQYQSFQSGIGYISEQTEDEVYYVTYTGTRTTKMEKVNDFALLRSAELTLEKGFDYFIITEAINNKKERDQAGAIVIDAPAALRNSSANDRPQAKSELTIVLYKEKPKEISYEARTIAKALKDEYEIVDKPVH